MLDRLTLIGTKTGDMVASAICSINGQEVDCATVIPFAGIILILFLFFWLFVIALSIAAFVFWILMLIHAAAKPIENRPVWVVVIALTHFIGALVYYFVVKRPFDKNHRPIPPKKQS